MPGLIREARDMQGIKEAEARKGGQGKSEGKPEGKPDASPPAPGEPPAERGPRKKG
jgi:hypothetical protein